MPKEKLKTIYVCTQCGETSPRWLGRCPSCGAWNTIVERPAEKAARKSPAASRGSALGVAVNRPRTMAEVETTDELPPWSVFLSRCPGCLHH